MPLMLALAPARVEIERGDPPAGLSGAIVVGLALLALIAWVTARRGGRGPGGRRRLSSAVGSALSEFAAPLQPDRPTIMEIERARAPIEPEDVGDGRDPTPPTGPSINAPPGP